MRSILRPLVWPLSIAYSIALAGAPQAVVIKPQIPLYLEQGNEESIVEYRLKGDLIFLYDNHQLPANKAEVYSLRNTEPYYQTFDRNGRLVFVSVSDVEVYYNDDREIEATNLLWTKE
jgi:hypothetical protein